MDAFLKNGGRKEERKKKKKETRKKREKGKEKKKEKSKKRKKKIENTSQAEFGLQMRSRPDLYKLLQSY